MMTVRVPKVVGIMGSILLVVAMSGPVLAQEPGADGQPVGGPPTRTAEVFYDPATLLERFVDGPLPDRSSSPTGVEIDVPAKSVDLELFDGEVVSLEAGRAYVIFNVDSTSVAWILAKRCEDSPTGVRSCSSVGPFAGGLFTLFPRDDGWHMLGSLLGSEGGEIRIEPIRGGTYRLSQFGGTIPSTTKPPTAATLARTGPVSGGSEGIANLAVDAVLFAAAGAALVIGSATRRRRAERSA